jgi:tetratricopeptide (TPR) repeat protein
MPKLWGVLIVCALAGDAAANPTADKLFDEGRALLAKGDPRGACDKFESAIKLDPGATGTMLNLGLCYEKLGKYATSIAWFRRAQARATEHQLAEYAEAATKYTVELAPKVPTLAIQVVGPADTEIRLDGDKVDPTDYGQLEVDPGKHELTGTADGKQPATVSVDAKIRAKLVPVRIDVTRDLARAGGGHRKRNAILLGVGGAALLGASLGTALYWQKQGEAAVDPDANAQTKITYVSNGLFVAGIAAVGVAAYLYVTAPSAEAPRTAFAPFVTGDQAGFAVTGAF